MSLSPIRCSSVFHGGESSTSTSALGTTCSTIAVLSSSQFFDLPAACIRNPWQSTFLGAAEFRNDARMACATTSAGSLHCPNSRSTGSSGAFVETAAKHVFSIASYPGGSCGVERNLSSNAAACPTLPARSQTRRAPIGLSRLPKIFFSTTGTFLRPPRVLLRVVRAMDERSTRSTTGPIRPNRNCGVPCHLRSTWMESEVLFGTRTFAWTWKGGRLESRPVLDDLHVACLGSADKPTATMRAW